MTTRRITVAEADADPNGYPLAFGVEITRETAAAGDRGRVQVTVTNRGEDTFEFQTGFPGVFGGLHSREREPGLFLYPTGSGPPYRQFRGWGAVHRVSDTRYLTEP